MIGKHKHELNKSAEKRVINSYISDEKRENISKVRELAKKGYNMSQIGREIGHAPSYVFNICSDYKIETSSRHKRISKEDIDQIKYLASEYPLKEVFERSKFSKGKTRGIMIENGIKAKPNKRGRHSELTKVKKDKKIMSLKNMDVFEVSKLILKDKGYKNSAEYIAENGYIAFQNNIKPLVDKKMDSIKQSNNQ